MTLKQSVCHKVMRTFLKSTAALQLKGSLAEPVAAAPVPAAGLWSPRPQPHALSASSLPMTKSSSALPTEAHSRREEQLKQRLLLCLFFLFIDFLMY